MTTTDFQQGANRERRVTEWLMITLHKARTALLIRDAEDVEEEFRCRLTELSGQIYLHQPSIQPEPSEWFPYVTTSAVDPWSAVDGVLTLALDCSLWAEGLATVINSDRKTWHQITDTCLEILKRHKAVPDDWLSGEAFTAELEEYRQFLTVELELELEAA